MLKQLTEALASDDIAVVKAALFMFVQTDALADLYDARWYWLDQECEIDQIGIVSQVAYAVAQLISIGWTIETAREQTFGTFIDGGFYEDEPEEFKEEFERLWKGVLKEYAANLTP